MVDKKISELNAATTIGDSDDFAVVQAAETKQVNASVIKTYASTAPAIVGGTINSASIGATTPSTGNFTTLGATGNVTLGDASGDTVTLNSGTVTLNNSTTISAASTKTLTLNGGAGSNGLVIDASNNVGIGATTPVLGKLNVVTGFAATDTTARPIAFFSSSDTPVAGTVPSGLYLQYTGNATIGNRLVELLSATYGSGTYGAMRLNNSISILSSGNVGIGTTSPAQKLHVSAAANVITLCESTNASTFAIFQTQSSDGNTFAFRLNGPSAVTNASVAQIYTSGTIPIAYLIGGVELMRLTASGSLGIGTTSPNSYGKLAVLGSSGNVVSNTVNTSVTSGDTAQNIITANTYTLTQVVNANGNITSYSNGAFYAIGTTSSAPTLFVTNNAERARIDASGNLLVTGVGGLGYGTGSGGAVTQATSRTTGVTLNKTNGAITLVSAAGSTAWQSFTVTNSAVAATDVVQVSQKSGTDLYEIHVTAVAAGSFRISFKTTGGTTTEQPVFNFAIIKAVTA